MSINGHCIFTFWSSTTAHINVYIHRIFWFSCSPAVKKQLLILMFELIIICAHLNDPHWKVQFILVNQFILNVPLSLSLLLSYEELEIQINYNNLWFILVNQLILNGTLSLKWIIGTSTSFYWIGSSYMVHSHTVCCVGNFSFKVVHVNEQLKIICHFDSLLYSIYYIFNSVIQIFFCWI